VDVYWQLPEPEPKPNKALQPTAYSVRSCVAPAFGSSRALAFSKHQASNMAKLEDLKPDTRVIGIIPGQTVSIVDVKWHGSTAVELFYKRADGQAGTQLLFRDDEPNLEIAETRRAWRFNADGDLFRLVAEAYRIHLAHLFDPVLAVHTSLIEPLPHQITGVYGDMLPRQPLRFLLADDPGAGKTIMAGLFIKELSCGATCSAA
jgi:hypothetical protein